MDPFAIIEILGQKIQTQVSKEGGKCPVWNHSFEVEIEYDEDQLKEMVKLSVYEEDLASDDFVGDTMITVKDLIGEKKQGKLMNYSLNYKGKSAGTV